MKRSVLAVLVGAVVMAGCGGGGGSGGGMCGQQFGASKMCQLSCTPGSATMVEEAQELLGPGADVVDLPNGSSEINFRCIDDGTENEFTYWLTFTRAGLQSVAYDGQGTYGTMPDCLNACAGIVTPTTR